MLSEPDVGRAQAPRGIGLQECAVSCILDDEAPIVTFASEFGAVALEVLERKR